MESKDVFGGFLGRTFLIAESQTNLLNPLIDNLENPPDITSLTGHLKELTKLKGPFKSMQDTPAGELYKEWYLDFYQTVQTQDVEDKTGTIRRTKDSIKKVAMLLSLAHSTDLVIHKPQMEEAIKVCEKLIGNIRKTTYGKKGLSSYAVHKTLIIQELMRRPDHRITRLVLAKKYWMHFGVDELDVMMRDFETGGLIKASSRGNTVIYEMPEAQVKVMERFLEGKNK